MIEPRIQGRPGLNNIAVFRALNLGDMLCAVPALRALRESFPEAHITLIGLESARPLMPYLSAYLDELIEFPGDTAFPEQEVDVAALPGFYRDMRSRSFDLVLQMHGSGRQSNQVVERMKPKQWVGFVPTSCEEVNGRFLAWPDQLNEIHRYLALLKHVGLNAEDDSLEFPITWRSEMEAERKAARHGLRLERTVFIHPGARLASRRWPVDRYAEVARALKQEGWQIAITGSAAERDIVSALESRAGESLINLCGATQLGLLAALLSRGRLLVCNDTGISHMAACVRLRSVVIASGSDVSRWSPLDSRRHTVLHTPMSCRPCAHDECPIGHPCALGIEVQQVLESAHRHLLQEE